MQSEPTRVVGEGARREGLVADQPSDQSLALAIRSLEERMAVVELAAKSPPEGLHNAANYGEQTLFDRVESGDTYRDRSVIMVMPAYKPIAHAVWSSWLSLLTPANHRVYRLKVVNCEVADAYNRAVEIVLSDNALNQFSYILTLEADNIVPPMGLLQLFHDMDEADVDVIGAIYFSKGPGGAPMAFGKVGESPRTFRPFIPERDSVTRVNATGMGCTLFKLDLFRRVSKPWFKTHQEWTPNIGMESLLTQDIFFADKAAREAGAKFAVSTRVLVGHLEEATGIIW